MTLEKRWQVLVCPNCGKEFTIRYCSYRVRMKRSKKIHCSMECALMALRASNRGPSPFLKKRYCVVCGGEIQRSEYDKSMGRGVHRKTCSAECCKMLVSQNSKLAQSRRPELPKEKLVTCLACGKSFSAKRDSNIRYCSRECRGTRTGRLPRNAKCLACGAELRRSPAALKRAPKGGAFCSRKCHSAYAWTETTCAFCGKVFRINKIRKARSIENFCSRKCAIERRKRLGPAAKIASIHQYRREWSDRVKERDGGACIICGDKGNGDRGELHAHHIRPASKHKKIRRLLENGVTLCSKCHLAIHHPHLADEISKICFSNGRDSDGYLHMRALINGGRMNCTYSENEEEIQELMKACSAQRR